MSLTPAKAQSITGKTQANGAQTITIDPGYNLHQIQFEPSATPGAGTLALAIRNKGATAYYTVVTLTLTDTTQYMTQIRGHTDSILATPTDFDAAKTYSLHVTSSRE